MNKFVNASIIQLLIYCLATCQTPSQNWDQCSHVQKDNNILCFGDKGRTEEDEDPKLKTTIKYVVT